MFELLLQTSNPDLPDIETSITLPLFMHRYTHDQTRGFIGDYLGLGADIFAKISDLCYLQLELQSRIKKEEAILQQLQTVVRSKGDLAVFECHLIKPDR